MAISAGFGRTLGIIYSTPAGPLLPAAAAVAAPALSQPLPRHPAGLLADIAGLHLAAAVLGAGVGSLLVPPLVDRAG